MATTRTKVACCVFSIVFSLSMQGLNMYISNKSKEKNTSFRYYELEDGTYQANEEVKHSAAITWVLVERINEYGNKELCIVNRDGINVLTNEFLGEINFAGDIPFSEDVSILSVANIEPYINQFGIKELYSAKYFESLIEAISENYEWHKDKVLEIKISY